MANVDYLVEPSLRGLAGRMLLPQFAESQIYGAIVRCQDG